MKHYQAPLNGNIIELPKPVCKILEIEKHQSCMVCPTFNMNGLALLSLPIWEKIETSLSHLDNNKNNDRLKFRTLFFSDVAIASGNQIKIHPQLIQLFLSKTANKTISIIVENKRVKIVNIDKDVL